jgi:hypothetical protein
LLSLEIGGQQFSRSSRRHGRHAVRLRLGLGAAVPEHLLLQMVAVPVVGAVADGDLEVEQDEQLQLQLVHLPVAHAADAREEGVVVVAASI